MSEAQKELLEGIAEDLNGLPDEMAAIAAAKISGFAEGVRAAQLQTSEPSQEEE